LVLTIRRVVFSPALWLAKEKNHIGMSAITHKTLRSDMVAEVQRFGARLFHFVHRDGITAVSKYEYKIPANVILRGVIM
jgi:hypothetical protein